MATEEAAFRRLVDVGRERGFVTLDQVSAELPVDDMSQTELAETLDRLERAGVSVEVDEELTRARPLPVEDLPDFRLPEPPEVQEHGASGHGAAGGESRTRMAVVFGGLLLLLVLVYVLVR